MTLPFVRGSAVCRDRGGGETGGGGGREGETCWGKKKLRPTKLNFHFYYFFIFGRPVKGTVDALPGCMIVS